MNIRTGPSSAISADCLGMVFEYLSLHDRHSVELVCKSWHAISRRVPFNGAYLSMEWEQHINSHNALFKFSDEEWRVPLDQAHPTNVARTLTFLGELLLRIGEAVVGVSIGGKLRSSNGFDVAVLEGELIPPIFGAGLFSLLLQRCPNIASISLRKMELLPEATIELADFIDSLCVGGVLRKFCLHDGCIFRRDDDALYRLAVSVQRLKQLSLYQISDAFADSFLTAYRTTEASQRKMEEVHLQLHHVNFQWLNEYDSQNRLLMALAPSMTVVMSIRDSSAEVNLVPEHTVESLRQCGDRLRSLDLRIVAASAPKTQYNVSATLLLIMNGLKTVPIANLVEFRLSGSQFLIDKPSFTAMVQFLRMALSLRILSLSFGERNEINCFQELAVLDRLEELNIAGASYLDDDTLSLLAQKMKLRKILLKHCRRVTAASISTLLTAANETLEAVEFANCISIDLHRLLRQMLKDIESPVQMLKHLEYMKFVGNNNWRVPELKRLLYQMRCQLGIKYFLGEQFLAMTFKNFKKWYKIRGIGPNWLQCRVCHDDYSTR